jgi:hypothetical protein
MFAGETRRADIIGASTTTVQFATNTGLTVRPIRLWAPSGRQAALTALPTAVTISGGAGTKYVYAVLAAPSGDPYSTASGGILNKLLNDLPWLRSYWYNALRAIHPGDGTLIDPARSSTVTLEMTASATPTNTDRVALGEVEWSGTAITSLTSYESRVTIATALLHGQCKLILSGGNLSLIPRDGQSLIINGVARTVTGSITLAPSGLSVGVVQYIYAAWSGSAITLAASTTGHSTHTNGVEIKTGDATQTLVGMVYPVTGPAFADSNTVRCVRSWFSDRGVGGRAVLTADRTTTSATFVHINIEARVSLLIWANEIVMATVGGRHIVNSAGATTQIGIGIDSTTVPEQGHQSLDVGSNTQNRTTSASTVRSGLAEGFHEVNVLAATGAGTLTLEGTTSPDVTALNVLTMRIL